ncbi:class I SAM-dependent DNA methyltransferase [Neokomagataea anthophila]|uniref:site-specific DNA-methyltransferase (adenine-specific) n=1 Tax=Neokomagataea anthophila TaxID=2826925 RepID=A0ABS5E9V2_9PROT|nr:class I SAM-dependent DNA methyltransferase [Neokomagataea anthophila]MBR0560688.1 class I SAM-dependent DNA methyltransferase [Neokomagataea anthophila]
MNAVEIEEAVSALAEQPFDAEEFPYLFLLAFGNKDTTIKRLRASKGSTNASDIPGGVLQRNNIHIATCPPGEVTRTLTALRGSPATSKAKAKFILTTDGETFEAEELDTGETVACAYTDFPNHFGTFLPLAGITTVKPIRENSFDIRATSKLNRLYVELLKDNPDWGTADRRHDMNHFMARLIFCFFAEDTDIFQEGHSFTNTVDTMTERDSSNTHEVIGELFRAMNTPTVERKKAGIARYADRFPYVNGGLFSGSPDVPRFSKIARSYLIHIGALDWTKINPDIFGSMIQAVADDEERGALGMHYTSVPNILKVLNPLFLDDLRARLDEAGDNTRMLLNLRKRIARIRVFDPACGSGNFLVIAYKEMRALEAEINSRRGEADRPSEIPLTNFRGIELRDFPAEIARLALIIAEFQCDVLYRGQQLALAEFLPLNAENWIICDNALRLDWLSVFPSAGTEVKHRADDLFPRLDQPQIDFDNEGGETYICGNPPYKGARKQDPLEKSDLTFVFSSHPDFKDADYVAGWFLKSAEYCKNTGARFALVATSSICQGEQVQFIWPRIWSSGQEIFFAYTPFKWANNASNNAGVFVTIVGVSPYPNEKKFIFDEIQKRDVANISPYITNGPNVVVRTAETPISKNLPKMIMGNMARDNGNLIMTRDEARQLLYTYPTSDRFLVALYGTKEIIDGVPRMALNLEERDREVWSLIPPIHKRVMAVKKFRLESTAKTTNGYANVAYRFAQYCHKDERALAIPSVTPEDRAYVTPLLIPKGVMVTNLAYLVYGFGNELFSLLSSRMHKIWITAVSGRLGSGIRYTPTISYHTFPVPVLTDKMKADLTRCAEDILLARAAHFPATIAELYDPEKMPADLREAHDRNDEVLERIYIGRCFRNDTERLEKLFDLYTKMTAGTGSKKKVKA